MTVRMRSESECFAKAAAMEQQAMGFGGASVRTHYLELARTWRHLAGQARWQDALLHEDVGRR